jgi:hypothetical protein
MTSLPSGLGLELNVDVSRALKNTSSKLKVLEEKYAKYLFTKYINHAVPSTLNSKPISSGREFRGTGVPTVHEQDLSADLSDEAESSLDDQATGAVDEPVTYSRYLNRLFIKKRVYITQHELLVAELAEIANADKLYADNPDFYPAQNTEYGYPDEFRCNYIKKDQGKHKLYRCGYKIARPNSEYHCTKHMLEKNCFLDEYNKLASALT